jgi:hypothetical protein
MKPVKPLFIHYIENPTPLFERIVTLSDKTLEILWKNSLKVELGKGWDLKGGYYDEHEKAHIATEILVSYSKKRIMRVLDEIEASRTSNNNGF